MAEMESPKEFVVSALKFRPQTFEQVTGQTHITQTIRNAVRKSRLANAYLFCGPRGVGKTSTARIFAKAINCLAAEDGEPCNQCVSCRSITEGRCLDVIEMDAASNRGIDEVRDLRENVQFPPVTGRYKVYIIDEAHQLTREAFNALLKTLEEPPEHAKFVLATTEANKMPDTIVSRCQQFRFKPLSLQQIVANLQQCLSTQTDNPLPQNLVEDVLYLIARASDGGMRDAQSLLDQVMSLADESLSLEEVELVLGGVRLDVLLELTDAVQSRNALEALEIVHRAYSQGQAMAQLLHDLLAHFRNLMVARVAAHPGALLELPADHAARVVEQSKRIQLEDVLHGIDILFDAERRLRFSDSARTICETTVVRLAKMPTTYELEALLGYHNHQINTPSGTKINPPEQKVTPAVAKQPATLRSESKPQMSASGSADNQTEPTSTPLNSAPVSSTAPSISEQPPSPPAPGQIESPPKTAVDAPAPAAISIQMDETPEQDLVDQLLESWEKFIHQVGEKDIRYGGLLGDAIPVQGNSKQVEFAIPAQYEFHLKQLSDPQAVSVMREVLWNLFGCRPEILVRPATPEEIGQMRQPVALEDIPSDRRAPSFEEVIEAEPVIQKILDEFEGTILEIKNNPSA